MKENLLSNFNDDEIICQSVNLLNDLQESDVYTEGFLLLFILRNFHKTSGSISSL